jgi:hypothetical protein
MNEVPSSPEQSRSTPARLTRALLALMLLQSAAGLVAPRLYRDAEPIRLLWLGNDAVTLLLVCPLLLLSVSGARSGAPRWQALRTGLVGYAVYNYAFYMLGTVLNAFFLLYVAVFVLSIAALIATLASARPGTSGDPFLPRAPMRAVAGYMMALAGVLALVWTGMWARHVFAAAPLPGGPEMFRLVAAMDLSFMLPALMLGGALLWRRGAWGLPVASLALVQGALYLLVLSVNSLVAVVRGVVPWPGELPVWGTMCVATSIAALALVAGVRTAPQSAATPTGGSRA